MAKKTAVKSEAKVKVSRISVFTGMIIVASMAIGAFLTLIFTR